MNQELTYTPARVIAAACFLAWAALGAMALYELVQRGSEDFYGSNMVFAYAIAGVLGAAGAVGAWLRKPVAAALVIIAAGVNHFAGIFSEGVHGDYNWGLTILSAVLALVVCVYSFLTDQNHA
ncbi:hypothetical protein [Porphyrobacter sp. AAP82]|uniref:hypothetical protein n=1 Tax=Porphyrobacter sp. AAP82 TaxID=1248917 RepID=UPI0002EE172F|nr:hypothetical protein [Porphyrobacter sp. AAP82]